MGNISRTRRGTPAKLLLTTRAEKPSIPNSSNPAANCAALPLLFGVHLVKIPRARHADKPNIPNHAENWAACAKHPNNSYQC